MRTGDDRLISAAEIAASPAWLPLEPDGNAVKLVRLDEPAYQAASFLDQRLLQQGFEVQRCSSATLVSAARPLPARQHYLFHIGHVGSTLIARLVGAHTGYFVLREPAVLRALAAGPPTSTGLPELPVVLALLSRTWHVNQQPVIKLTSFANELAHDMLAAAARPAAVCMFVQPIHYLRGILAGPNSRVESRQLAPARLRRLAQRAQQREWQPQPRSEGESIAMSWLSEMATLRQATRGLQREVLWMDFDAFLAEPAGALQAIFGALGEVPVTAEIEALVHGPLMRQYSKAPAHAYDAGLRRAVLAQADHEHADEIRRGMDWLQAAVAQHPAIGELIL
jgi:hypothetical protein